MYRDQSEQWVENSDENFPMFFYGHLLCGVGYVHVDIATPREWNGSKLSTGDQCQSCAGVFDSPRNLHEINHRLLPVAVPANIGDLSNQS